MPARRTACELSGAKLLLWSPELEGNARTTHAMVSHGSGSNGASTPQKDAASSATIIHDNIWRGSNGVCSPFTLTSFGLGITPPGDESSPTIALESDQKYGFAVSSARFPNSVTCRFLARAAQRKKHNAFHYLSSVETYAKTGVPFATGLCCDAQ
jgi:hypothetical protein